MDAREYIRHQVAAIRRTTDAILDGTTDEQFNWQPFGTANSLRTTLVHTVGFEDKVINEVLQGQPTVWDTHDWAGKLGLTGLPGREHGWDEIRSAWLAASAVLEYQREVREAVDAYISGLSAAELGREVTFLGAARPVGDALAIVLTHAATHAGDMAAVKGVQGVKGLPY